MRCTDLLNPMNHAAATRPVISVI